MLKLKASAALTGTHLHVSRNNGPLLSDNERNCRVGLSALSARHKLNVFSQFEEIRINTGEMPRSKRNISPSVCRICTNQLPVDLAKNAATAALKSKRTNTHTQCCLTSILMSNNLSRGVSGPSDPLTMCKDGRSHHNVTHWFCEPVSEDLRLVFATGRRHLDFPLCFQTGKFYIWTHWPHPQFYIHVYSK